MAKHASLIEKRANRPQKMQPNPKTVHLTPKNVQTVPTTQKKKGSPSQGYFPKNTKSLSSSVDNSVIQFSL